MIPTRAQLIANLRRARAAIKAMRIICAGSTPKQRLAQIDLIAKAALEMTE